MLYRREVAPLLQDKKPELSTERLLHSEYPRASRRVVVRDWGSQKPEEAVGEVERWRKVGIQVQVEAGLEV